jgi:predicted MPP superfamily phosphohydrolase
MALSPDLILLTGDYVHPRFGKTRDAVTADLRRMIIEERIVARLGVYAVRGNVDRDWPAVFQGTQVACLADQNVRIRLDGGRSLSLVGLDLKSSFGATPGRTRALVATTPESDLRIVIGHAPDYAAILAGWVRVDLALAGHTHGGQIALPFIGPLVTFSELPRRFGSGLNDYKGVPLHVTRGVGIERGHAPQVRFLCRPEVCLLEVDY